MIPAALGVLLITSAASPTPNTPAPTYVPAPATQVQYVQQAPAQKTYTAPAQAEPSLSNDNYYVNTAGNTVHSPAYTSDSSVPAGASAQCRDGTYSFSQNRRGTCSHHGGVARWL